ncbi:radical SAM protein [Mediterraneibacter gnavus]|uniref:Radical SAM protein n=1 Tax=Mediterraneibacter gnavus TaxID=33038 RepID=A0A2N5P5W3_MEDGN|nr:radical SAM protein [Mediterraneibacter gnavus]PLT70455.1 radical SAM protein [Mediterraneibacter gnavus]
MYTITLEVNQICNLRCNYCYLGEKTNQKMSEDIAYKGLEIAFLNVEKHKDKRLWVDFVGGEALISFGFLQKLVEYIEEEAAKRTITVAYSITTNGTIMNDKILEWFINNKVHLKLSIDGTMETHDRNRKSKIGIGSYRNIMKNINYFREYEERTKQYIQVAHVVTQNNYWEVFKSVKHLVEELHFSIVDSSIDVSHRWTVEQLDKLGKEWEKILCYYIKKIEIGRAFLWAPVLDLKKYGEESENSGFCGVGLIQIYVKADGRIYGCAANLDSNGCLGDVERGFSVKKIKEYRELANPSPVCLMCSLHPKCQSCKCIMNNLAYSNQISGYNPDMCYFEKKKISLWNKYDKIIG